MANKTIVDLETDLVKPYIDKVKSDAYKYGACNLLVYPYYYKSRTDNGLTYTVNSDGTVDISGSVTSGQTSNFYFSNNSVDAKTRLAAGTYRISGCPSGGSSTTYYIQVYDETDGNPVNIANDTGSGDTFTLTKESPIMVRFRAYSAAGSSVNGKTVKPMITPVSYTGGYVPYSGTNAQLTQDMLTNADNIASVKSGNLDLVHGNYTSGTAVTLTNWTGIRLLFINANGGDDRQGVYLTQCNAGNTGTTNCALVPIVPLQSSDLDISLSDTTLTFTPKGGFNGRYRYMILSDSNY